ncbi:MAG TPA: 7,8-dihydro-8-oxoguanine triphosphatase, partial [Propionibacteriaceae bacterium]|nr:7,8-dihydro-8-oxoguanine triphosphatase [Propionibacteriaceae bacterium]
GELPASNDEGTLTWERLDALDSLPMWEGDRHFLPLVFDESVGQFHAHLPYESGRPVGWSVSVL